MRYKSPIANFWTDEYRYQVCWELSQALMKMAHDKGYISQEQLNRVMSAQYDRQAHLEQEGVFKHDIVALTHLLKERSGVPQVHLGVTSSDIVDSALVKIFRKSTSSLMSEAVYMFRAFEDAIARHDKVIVMGRTHGKIAEPITWGWRLRVYQSNLERCMGNVQDAVDSIAGKLSGPTGTYTFWSMEDEKNWTGCDENVLTTQIIPRDFFARVTTNIAILATHYEKIATDLRLYAFVGSYNEPFEKEQRGSSSMPHKMNPITLEQIAGLARKIRHNAANDVENILSWLERDIAHSSNERLSWAETWNLIGHLTGKMTEIITDLKMKPEALTEEAWSSRHLNEAKLQGLDNYKQIQSGETQTQMFMEDKVLHHFSELGK